MIREKYNTDKLRGNPVVVNYDWYKVSFTTEFKILLFLEWKKRQSQEDIQILLKKHNLGPDVLGHTFHYDLASAFKQSGYPTFKGRDDMLRTTAIMGEHPLVKSGRFIYSAKYSGIIIEPSFEESIFRRYPEVGVEEILLEEGLDLLDVGYQRVRKIKKSCEEYHQKEFQEVVEAVPVFEPEEDKAENPILKLRNNPYVIGADGVELRMHNAFYNEVYMLPVMPIDKILNIYGIDKQYVSNKSLIQIGINIRDWNPTGDVIDIETGEFLQILRNRQILMEDCVEKGFAYLKDKFLRLDIESKRNVCKWIDELPRDSYGFYTKGKVLELTGISKSTYYALLHDENYGSGAIRKANQDELDIEVIRQVLAYKGFEKGIRQVYMLMPKVAGEQFSIYRIRRLMNKYGIRTTIRRPSKNRKAMKELIARNKKANLLMRKFKLHRPNEVRLTDVTYLDYGDGLRAYGSASVDPVTGRLICFIISENNDLQLALDTLEAMDSYPAKSGAILHSDQGILYMTDDFQAAVVERELTQSMSRRGNCWDNAVQESFFGHFKDECHYEGCKTYEELQKCIAEYSDYYNNERGMWDKGEMTPAEYEKYLTEMDDEAFAKYLADEEKKYLEMKEKAAEKAVQNAKEYKAFIEDAMEELK